jgi:hypothetical protein
MNMPISSSPSRITTVKAALLLAALLFCAACAPAKHTPVDAFTVKMSACLTSPGHYWVTSDSKVDIKLENDTQQPYQWMLMAKDVLNGFKPSDQANIFWQTEIPAGQTVEQTVHVPAMPGQYQVLCGPSGQVDGTVIGSLTVVAPGY